MDRRKVIVGAAAVIAVLVAFFVLRDGETRGGGDEEHVDPNMVELGIVAQRNISLTAEEVREERIRQPIKATGVVAPDEKRVAHILPLAQGVVEQVFVQLGDRVTKGHPLLQYDNIELGELIGEHLSLQGQVEREKAQLQVAKRSVERANALIQVEAISPREYELRRAEEQQAQAAVASKQADLAKVEEKLHRFGLSEEQVQDLRSGHGEHRTASHNTLRAPFAGVITRYDVSQGELVTREKELFTIVDTSSVWVLADVYEKDISLVPRTGECLVSVPSYPEERFNGEVAYVSDFLDPSSRTAKVRCVVANRDGRLKLEMFADVFLPTTRTAPVVTIPATAVQEVHGEAVVFVQKDATHFERRTVKLGQRGGERVQALEGVQKGERVVANGSFHLKSALLREQIGEEE